MSWLLTWLLTWPRKVSCRLEAWRQAYRHAKEQQRHYKRNRAGFKTECKAARKSGKAFENPGPPPTGFSLLPWLLMGMGAFSNLFKGETPNAWIGALGLLTFNSLYIYVVFRAFLRETREATSTRLALVLMGLVTCGLALGYGGNWLLFFPLFGLATGAVVRMPHLRWAGTGVAVLSGIASVTRDGWGGLDIAYATWISTMVTAAILSLSEAVRELRAAREELARRAVEKERLRFSRDLHDLLGHTMSVIVVKAEAARRLAGRDLTAALEQITDIESVGRQALTEIREAVTGYREGSLTTELDRARSALSAAGVELVVSQSGPPLPPQTEVLLGWVVREAVTNVVRHSGASRCEVTVAGVVTVAGAAERVRLRVTDDGGGAGAGSDSVVGRTGAEALGEGLGGTGLKGLTERLAAAGGSLTAGPGTRGGFAVTAELPLEAVESAGTSEAAGSGGSVSTAEEAGSAAPAKPAEAVTSGHSWRRRS